MFIEVNSQVSVEELLQGMIVQSGNDASVALAEFVAGSEETFAEMMNQYAVQLGMVNSSFQNSTGLPAKDHYTSPRDIAILARHFIRKYAKARMPRLTASRRGIPNRPAIAWFRRQAAARCG